MLTGQTRAVAFAQLASAAKLGRWLLSCWVWIIEFFELPCLTILHSYTCCLNAPVRNAYRADGVAAYVDVYLIIISTGGLDKSPIYILVYRHLNILALHSSSHLPPQHSPPPHVRYTVLAPEYVLAWTAMTVTRAIITVMIGIYITCSIAVALVVVIRARLIQRRVLHHLLAGLLLLLAQRSTTTASQTASSTSKSLSGAPAAECVRLLQQRPWR